MSWDEKRLLLDENVHVAPFCVLQLTFANWAIRSTNILTSVSEKLVWKLRSNPMRNSVIVIFSRRIVLHIGL